MKNPGAAACLFLSLPARGERGEKRAISCFLPAKGAFIVAPRIAVLERNARIGGGCSTDTDRLPGFRTCIVIHKDIDKTCASLARFSKQDAETFRALWHTYCIEMRPLLASLLYNAPLPREQLIDRLSGLQAKELLLHAQHDLFSVVRKHFVDERIRTLFTSYMHVITTENAAGAGIVFPAIFANIASFKRGWTPLPPPEWKH